MNGYCTYTVEAHTEDESRDVPCGKPRAGVVTGPGLRVWVCKRHADKVARALLRDPGAALVIELDVAP